MKNQRRALVAALLLVLGAIAVQASPTPYITEMSPVAVPPGAPPFTLTIKGTGFVAGAVVTWEIGASKTPLETTFVSGTQLTAAVPASLVAKAATAFVTVMNPDGAPVENRSNGMLFEITSPTTGVTLKTSATLGFYTGGSDQSIAVGDFNGDGKPDLAAAALCSFPCTAGTVEIRLGNGDGTFTAAPTINVGPNPISVAVGDFNRDGKLDLALITNADFGNGAASILLGLGNGTFIAASTFSMNSPVRSFGVADFNGDGALDLATVTATAAPSVSILLGNGDGTLTAGSTYSMSGAYFYSLALGDFNGDAKLDMSVGSFTLLGNGDGTFTLRSTGLFTGVLSAAVADFNGDGKLDLAAANEFGSVSIELGNGDGTFTTGSRYTFVSPASVAAGDFNGDNKLDLVLPDYDPQSYVLSVIVLLGDGVGNFTVSRVTLDPDVQPTSAVAADFNGDGRLDVAVSMPVFVYVQPPAPEPSVPAVLDFGNQNLGTTNTLPLTIANTGTAALIIDAVTIGGPTSSDFAATLNTCAGPVSPGSSCSIDVTFTPGSLGPRSATLALTTNATAGTHTVSLTGAGVGIPTARVSPLSLNFGNQKRGATSAAQTVTLSNIGSAPLAITAIATTGNFAQGNNCGSSVGAGTSCQIAITFTPQSIGPLSGTLTITDNSSTGSTQTVALTGVGLATFTIAPTPSTLTVKRGVLGGFLLTLKSVGGFKGNVALSCSGGPAGAKCANLPAAVNLDGTAYAVSGILFPKNTVPGTYTFTFTGVSGVITETATARFIVE